jgi:hypothetical protein
VTLFCHTDGFNNNILKILFSCQFRSSLPRGISRCDYINEANFRTPPLFLSHPLTTFVLTMPLLTQQLVSVCILLTNNNAISYTRHILFTETTHPLCFPTISDRRFVSYWCTYYIKMCEPRRFLCCDLHTTL